MPVSCTDFQHYKQSSIMSLLWFCGWNNFINIKFSGCYICDTDTSKHFAGFCVSDITHTHARTHTPSATLKSIHHIRYIRSSTQCCWKLIDTKFCFIYSFYKMDKQMSWNCSTATCLHHLFISKVGISKKTFVYSSINFI